MQESIHEFENSACGRWQSLLILSAAGEELSAAEQAALADHLAQCAACFSESEHEKDFAALIASQAIEPDATLLAECRAGLTDALDREEERSWWRRGLGGLIPADWLSPRPAWSAAFLILIGFSVGAFGPRLLVHRLESPPSVTARSMNSAGSANASVTVSNTNDLSSANESNSAVSGNSDALTSLDLHTADVAGINVFPSNGGEPPQVQLQMRAQQPITLEGTVDDGNVKRVLCYVLHNSDRFDPDMRLSAIDLLRSRKNNSDVRSALCHAVHSDPNAAVRLKALEALDGSEPQDIVRQTLLDALVDDQNPGVRIEAINSLRNMAASGQVVPDDHLLSVLHDRMDRDPNTYIRLQSAAAIRDFGQH
jgi:hypothetical protein